MTAGFTRPQFHGDALPPANASRIEACLDRLRGYAELVQSLIGETELICANAAASKCTGLAERRP
jgi:hypothetical protein